MGARPPLQMHHNVNPATNSLFSSLPTTLSKLQPQPQPQIHPRAKLGSPQYPAFAHGRGEWQNRGCQDGTRARPVLHALQRSRTAGRRHGNILARAQAEHARHGGLVALVGAHAVARNALPPRRHARARRAGVAAALQLGRRGRATLAPAAPASQQLSSWGAAAAPRHDGLRRKLTSSSTPTHFHASLHGWESPPGGDRVGWKRTGAGLQCDQRHCSVSPCTERMFDEEMTMYESQLSRAVSGHNGSGCFDVSDVEIPPPLELDSANEAAQGSEAREMQAAAMVVEGVSSERKRKRSDEDEEDLACGWVQPLKLLLRKILSVSDVGELGRIVLPKKDAEGQLPPVDTKEGKLLEMKDYTTSRHWYFRYKWWINNKSRMYVLENTGEFIKYHSLKEYDAVVLYEDGCGKLVVQAKKKIVNLNSPWVDTLKGSTNKESTMDSSEKAKAMPTTQCTNNQATPKMTVQSSL